jgi:hypothetical protein
MEGKRMRRPRFGRLALWLAGLSIVALGLGLAEPASADSDKGSISGKVTLDPALTDSTLDGIVVTAESSTLMRSAFAEDDGEFKIDDLPNGTYIVSFGASSGIGGDGQLLAEYYDDVYTSAEATAIVVSGKEVKNVNAELSRTGRLTLTPNPAITVKSLAAGGTLGSSTGFWSGPTAITFTYQWKRDGAAIDGATNSSYVIKAKDRGHAITLTITAAADRCPSVSRTSTAVSIPKVFTATPTPTITGTAKAGKVLTAHHRTWKPTPSFSYQWYRNGAKITGATKSTYKLTTSDKGKKITVKVTGKKSGYLAVAKTSAAKTVAK